MAFETHEQGGVVFLTSSLLPVPHAFSTRLGGVSPAPWDSLNLRPGMGDGQAALRENYRRFCACAGVDMNRLVLSKQVHETTVRLCTAADAGKGLDRERDYTADGLITGEKGLPLVVFSADCGVILLHDPVKGAAGASTPGGGAAPGESWKRPFSPCAKASAHGRRICWPPWAPASANAALRPTAMCRRPCAPPWGRKRSRFWSGGAPSTTWIWRG